MTNFLAECRALLSDPYVITEAKSMQPYLQDWRGRKTGRARAVVQPASAQEVAALVQLCQRHQISIVPQGGNTGLVWGGIPDQSGDQIVISLLRLNQIRQLDAINNTLECEAGCILQQVQQSAHDAQRLFPLSLAAEGSCTIGGNLSTNAGGIAVLRYGNMRELCLGLEVVTAEGQIWNGLRNLRKDNTGYDLRDLFIGAEGTLGIITAAVLKLFPKPVVQYTVLVGLASPAAAVEFLTRAQNAWDMQLTAFELISALCFELVQKHFPQLITFSNTYPYWVLFEISSFKAEPSYKNDSLKNGLYANDANELEKWLNQMLESGLVQHAVIAQSLAQAQNLWKMREHIPLAQRQEGKNIKHDISLPLSQIPAFITITNAELRRQFPTCRIVLFGHLGDGNLHYNVAPELNQTEAPEDVFLTQQKLINRIVLDQVHALGGSISAEHGIGAFKREELLRYKAPLELELMRRLKQAFDPDHILNPGKIL